MGDDERQVGRDEWKGTLGLLEEIRVDIKQDIRDLKTGQTDLSKQLAETDRRITSRQDIANGRTGKNEAAVIAAHAQIAALASQVTAVQETATAIKTGGCDQKDRHEEVLSALAAAGVAPSEASGEWRDPAERWTRRQKIGAAGLGLGGLGLGVFLPHLVAVAHWLLEHLAVK